MKLSKSLSQVFLKDGNYIDKILRSLDIEGEEVLEIGSGSGEISRRLSVKAKFLYCVELDSRFIPILREKLKDNANVEIIHTNILEFKLSSLGKKLVIFGNVPYQISNSLIHYLVKNREYIKKAYLTLQKEFAEKLTAQVSTKTYGYLSCYIQYHAKVTKIFDMPAKAFFPVPKVDSTFIKIEFYEKLVHKVDDEDFLFKIIRQAFGQRRKKIINSLSCFSPNRAFFASLGVDSHCRAENITLEKYINFANQLKELHA